MVKFVFAFVLALFSVQSFAAVSASSDKKKYLVGEKINYTVSVSDIPGAKLSLPENKFYYFNDEPVPLYEIALARYDESAGIFNCEISFYQTGKRQLPEIKITDASGASVGYLLAEVEIVPVNQQMQMEEDERPVDVSGYPVRLIVILALAVLIGALAVVLWKRFGKRKMPAPARTPAIDIFNAEADGIISEMQSITLEEYAEKMNTVFKKFLSAELLLNAEDLTTHETSEAVRVKIKNRGADISGEVYQLLSMLDLIKFAEADFPAELVSDNAMRIKKCAAAISREV